MATETSDLTAQEKQAYELLQTDWERAEFLRLEKCERREVANIMVTTVQLVKE